MAKLAILGGGGVRMPALVHELLLRGEDGFDEIALFEPEPVRREIVGGLSAALAARLGRSEVVTVTADLEAAVSGADFVFSAVRVGGDRGRIIDETVALSHGLVGQETIGPGGFAMALRTIPVVLNYCRTIERVAPQAVLINFTNPAGVITQAILSHTRVRAIGVCDTPSGTVERLSRFLEPAEGSLQYEYGGLNHLGWVSSVTVDGQERIDDLLANYEALSRFDHAFSGFDPDLVRSVGAIPTEYLYYYYYPRRYVESVEHAGATRGQNVSRLNDELLAGVAAGLRDQDFDRAWATYVSVMDVRHDSYMRLDLDGDSLTDTSTETDSGHGQGIGGYEKIAIAVMDSIASGGDAEVIVNTRNDSTLPFLDAEDTVEAPATIGRTELTARPAPDLPTQARSLVLEVKEYERAVVAAATTASPELAVSALALHPLVPNASVARELLREYREAHGSDLAYLQ